MVNIWNYRDSNIVRIIDKKGNIRQGTVICVLDKEETEREDDYIAIENADGVFEYEPSDIKKIENIE
ncbi:MAG: hypothetical protein IJO85_07480 [Lachnospiraceae bacterium]|nr:hypothetical protein [Lachnospiraceae bacterium]